MVKLGRGYVSSILILAISTLSMGCTQMETGDNTTMGAATGGALGAGLGAVVGNQVGNTGEGLVLGAAAGAGAGAVVGSVFDRQQEAIRNQDEAIERQERIMLAQQNELQELRQLGQDSVSFKGDSRPPVTQAASAGQYSFPSRPPVRNSRAQSGNSFGTTSAFEPVVAPRLPLPNSINTNRMPTTAAVEERSLIEPVQIIERDPPRDVDAPRPVIGFSNSTEPGVEAKTPIAKGSYSWEEKNNAARDSQRQSETDVRSPVARADLDSTFQAGQDATVAVNEIQPAQPMTATQQLALHTPECEQAEKEALAAMSARDSQNKLFHFRRALRLCPDNANYHNGMGEVYISINRLEDARYEFNEALRLNPNHGGAQSNLSSLQ